MKLCWWRKPKEESKPVPEPRPDPKTIVLILFRNRPYEARQTCWTLHYDIDPQELKSSVECGWMTWPVSRDGEMCSVPVDNVAAVIINPIY
jgi:hypothetical protein